MRLVIAAVALMPGSALAHAVGLSSGDLRVDGDEVAFTVRASEVDVRVLLPGASVREAALELARAIEVTQGGVACAAAAREVVFEPPDGVAVSGRFTCPSAARAAEVRLRFIDALPSGHTHVLRTPAGEHVVRRGASPVEIAGTSRPFARFFLLGVEHIFTGIDHLAFLLGLLLLGGRRRELVQVVTSFTVAHSLTLGAAAVGAVEVPASVVEPMIAASVLYVALENLWVTRAGAASEPARRRRWAVTFGFGLVHGLGFAGILRELSLPPGALTKALVAFNLGVEAGQLVVIAAAAPLLARLRRRPIVARAGVRLGSAGLAVAGVAWLAARLAAW